MSSLQPAELSPIEQYAVKFMEKLRENLDTEALEAAEEDITIAKEEWELTHMQVHEDRLSCNMGDCSGYRKGIDSSTCYNKANTLQSRAVVETIRPKD